MVGSNRSEESMGNDVLPVDVREVVRRLIRAGRLIATGETSLDAHLGRLEALLERAVVVLAHTARMHALAELATAINELLKTAIRQDASPEIREGILQDVALLRQFLARTVGGDAVQSAGSHLIVIDSSPVQAKSWTVTYQLRPTSAQGASVSAQAIEDAKHIVALHGQARRPGSSRCRALSGKWEVAMAETEGPEGMEQHAFDQANPALISTSPLHFAKMLRLLRQRHGVPVRNEALDALALSHGDRSMALICAGLAAHDFRLEVLMYRKIEAGLDLPEDLVRFLDALAECLALSDTETEELARRLAYVILCIELNEDIASELFPDLTLPA
jgi:hypothetical protein